MFEKPCVCDSVIVLQTSSPTPCYGMEGLPHSVDRGLGHAVLFGPSDVGRYVLSRGLECGRLSWSWSSLHRPKEDAIPEYVWSLEPRPASPLPAKESLLLAPWSATDQWARQNKHLQVCYAASLWQRLIQKWPSFPLFLPHNLLLFKKESPFICLFPLFARSLINSKTTLRIYYNWPRPECPACLPEGEDEGRAQIAAL